MPVASNASVLDVNSVPNDRPYTVNSDLSQLADLSNGFRDEWHHVLHARHSVTVQGPDEATEAVLLLLKPHLRQLVLWQPRSLQLQLPAVYPGALVLRHIDTLPAGDQGRLLAWLRGATTPVQVVSTTRAPLFDLVEAGLFDRPLYYVLNVALLCVGIDLAPARAVAT